MKPNAFGARGVLLVLSLCAMGLPLSSSIAAAQSEFVITPLAEKKVAELPAGELFWQVENFPTRAEAEAAAGPTALVAEAEGKVWLFTLGSKGAATSGGTKVVEIGLCHVSQHRSICCASIAATLLQVPKRRCTPIPAPRLSTCCLAN